MAYRMTALTSSISPSTCLYSYGLYSYGLYSYGLQDDSLDLLDIAVDVPQTRVRQCRRLDPVNRVPPQHDALCLHDDLQLGACKITRRLHADSRHAGAEGQTVAMVGAVVGHYSQQIVGW